MILFPFMMSLHPLAGLAKAALAGRVDGELVDTSFTMDGDAELAIITDRDVEGLEVIRHSTAHLLAQAVKQLFPDAQVTIGPSIEDGFYYDFAYKRPFTPEDLTAIEAKMKALVKENHPISRSVMSRDDAVKFFRDQGEAYKAEIIESIPANEDLSLYTQGEFTDLCRGPHVPGTGKLKAFKLMKLAGATGAVTPTTRCCSASTAPPGKTKKELKTYLYRLEEAEKRDHRKIGKIQDLFHTQEEAPGMVFWHHKGGASTSPWSSTFVTRSVWRAIRRLKPPRSLIAPCGRSPATGASTGLICSPPVPRIGTLLSSR